MGNNLIINASGKQVTMTKKAHGATPVVINADEMGTMIFDADSKYIFKTKAKVAKIKTGPSGLVTKFKNYDHKTFISFNNLMALIGNASRLKTLYREGDYIPTLVISHKRHEGHLPIVPVT